MMTMMMMVILVQKEISVFFKATGSFFKCCMVIPCAEAARWFPWLPYALAGPAAPSSSHPAFDQSLELGLGFGSYGRKRGKTRGKNGETKLVGKHHENHRNDV